MKRQIQIGVISLVAYLIFVNAQAQLKVASNGAVGVKISNPNKELHVKGDGLFVSSESTVTSAPHIHGTNSYSTSTVPDYTWWGNSQTGFYHPANNHIGVSINGTERLLFEPGGLKINSTGNWSRTIYVNALTTDALGYHMRYNGADNFYVHASGWIYSSGIYLGSDRIFKKDIQTIESALYKVKNLRGVNYKMDYKDDRRDFNNNEQCIGFIAQEVETVLPELVKTMGDGTKAVNYTNMIAVLVEAIKEQQIQLDALKYQLQHPDKKREASEFETAYSTHLEQNFPNPFTAETSVGYFIAPEANSASIMIFDMKGTLLRTYDNLKKGKGEIIIESGQLTPGMYMYSLLVNGVELDNKRMILTE